MDRVHISVMEHDGGLYNYPYFSELGAAIERARTSQPSLLLRVGSFKLLFIHRLILYFTSNRSDIMQIINIICLDYQKLYGNINY